MKNAPAEVSIEEFRDATAAPDGGVVLDTEAVVDGERRDTTIEVSEDDASAIAVALMSPDAPPATPGSLAPAMRCLAVGVIHTAEADLVRLHLQFDSGQVLPIELSPDAAAALGRGLLSHLGGGAAPPRA